MTAAYLAKGFVGKPGTEVVEISKVETGEILIAARDIAVGDRIDEAALSWASWPEDQISPTMISKSGNPDAEAKFKDGRARIQMFSGEPINEKKIVLPNDGGFMAAILPKGRRAISVRISAETGAGGFILPNDKVDVILTRKLSGGAGGGERQLSETVLSNVRVLAVDQTFKQDEKGEQVVVGKTATLELELAQAEVMAMAEFSGQLSLALRSIAESDNAALGDDGPHLSERYAKGSSGSEITISRWGVKSYTTELAIEAAAMGNAYVNFKVGRLRRGSPAARLRACLMIGLGALVAWQARRSTHSPPLPVRPKWRPARPSSSAWASTSRSSSACPPPRKDVIVGNPGIVDAVVRTQNRAYLFARAAGAVQHLFLRRPGPPDPGASTSKSPAIPWPSSG